MVKARIERSFRRKDALEFGIRKEYSRLQTGCMIVYYRTQGPRIRTFNRILLRSRKEVLGVDTNTRMESGGKTAHIDFLLKIILCVVASHNVQCRLSLSLCKAGFLHSFDFPDSAFSPTVLLSRDVCSTASSVSSAESVSSDSPSSSSSCARFLASC